MARRATGRGGNLQSYLRGVDYPATRDELLEVAEENGAPDEILDALEDLPDDEFESPIEVQEEIGNSAEEESDDRGRGRSSGRGSAGRSSSSRQEEERGSSRRGSGQGRVTSSQDRRLRGNETEELADARQMRRGDDGRGRVTDPETDRRLRQNRDEEPEERGGSRRGGAGDGRGRVTDPETDRRLRQNLGEESKGRQTRSRTRR
jgi:hypothetical protein